MSIKQLFLESRGASTITVPVGTDVKDIINNLNVLFPKDYEFLYFTEFGSKLYGTVTEDSDQDYYCVYLPSFNDRMLGKDIQTVSISSGVSHTKNTKFDIDVKMVNIFKFFEDLKKIDINALNLFFSIFDEKTTIFYDEYFVEQMKKNRELFLVKNSESFFSYCTKQARKYGLKGKDFSELLELRDLLQKHIDTGLITLDHKIGFHTNLFEKKYFENVEGEQFFKIGTKRFGLKNKISFLLKNLDLSISSYGDRTKEAMAAGGIDYKAISHAFRSLWQFEELANTGFIRFPITRVDEVMEIRFNKLFNDLEEAMAYLHSEMLRVNEIILASDLKDSIDTDSVDQVLIDFCKESWF